MMASLIFTLDNCRKSDYPNHNYSTIFQHFSDSLLGYASRHRNRRVLLAAALVVTLAAVAALSSVVVPTADPGYVYVSGLESYLPSGINTWQVPDFSAYVPGYAFAQVQDSTPPTFVSSNLNLDTGVLSITFSEDIDVTPATNVVPSKIHVRESGTYTGGVTLTVDELDTNADGAMISFTLTASHFATIRELTTPELTIEAGAVHDTAGGPIVNTFDVSTASWVDTTPVSTQNIDPTGMAFSSDGTKMFVVGWNGENINEYTLTSPWDASTARFVHAFNVTEQDTSPQDMAFSSDGTKMFVVGDNGNDINEYTLSSPWDASTAVFVNATSVSEQDTSPQGMAFSSDGTKMFVVGAIGDDINEYDLDIPWDASTARFVHAFDVSEQDTSPQGMAFSSDGTKMFVVGLAGGDINEYTLTSPWDASTARFVDAFDVSGQNTSPQGMAFSSDGTKMFVVSRATNSVNEYTLSTVYPITVIANTPPVFVSSDLNLNTSVLSITFSKDIDVTPKTEVDTSKIHIRESGTYTGGVTLTATELDTNTDGTTISFTLTASHLATLAGMSTPELTIEAGAVRDTAGGPIVNTFDVSTASWVDATSVQTQDTAPTGMAFSSDGTKMFVVGDNGDDINEYDLTSPWDASTADFVDAFDVSAQENFPRGMAFSSDGTKMFVVGTGGDDINEYDLSSPWDVSTADFVDATSVQVQENSPRGMAFSSDGTKMFVVGTTGDDINEYDLSSPWDASTAVFVNATSVSEQATDPQGMAFSSDGSKMFVVGNTGDDINEYTLSSRGTPPLGYLLIPLTSRSRRLIHKA